MPNPHPLAAAYYKAYLQSGSYAEVGRRFGVSRVQARKVILSGGYDVAPKRLATPQVCEKITTNFEWDTYKEVMALAQKTGTTASHQVRQAVAEYLERIKEQSNGTDCTD